MAFKVRPPDFVEGHEARLWMAGLLGIDRDPFNHGADQLPRAEQ
jgi:hypothetical protein